MAGTMFFEDRSYQALKRLNMVILPGLGVLFFVLWLLFDLPSVEWGLFAIFAFMFFNGLMLSASSRRYKAFNRIGSGEIVILIKDDGKRVYSLDLDDDPDNLVNLDEVRFKVRKPRN